MQSPVPSVPEAIAHPVSARRPRKLRHAITRELVRRVVIGEYHTGQLLPNETRLGEEFDVSRPVIRETMQELEAMGLISVRQGSGTVVRDELAWNFADSTVLRTALEVNLDHRMLSDTVALRCELETSILREAFPHLLPEDLDTLDAQVTIMEHDPRLKALGEADAAFHALIQKRAPNRLKRSLVALLLTQMPSADATHSPDIAATLYRKAASEHRRVVELLRTKDVDAAAAVLTNLITHHWIWQDERPVPVDDTQTPIN